MVDRHDSPAPNGLTGQANARQNDAGELNAEAPGPGELLAAGRIGLELTVDEVGDALNLAPQVVRSLESDDFDALPAAAFTQGYIRNFAKHVGLDADVVVTAYQAKAGKPAVAWQSPRTAAGLAEMVQRHPGVLITAVVVAVVVLIVIVLAVVWPEEQTGTVNADPLGIGQEAAGATGSISPLRAAESNGASADAAVGQLSPVEAGTAVPLVNSADSSPGGDLGFEAAAELEGGGFDRDAIDPNDPLAHLPLATTYPADALDSSVDSSTSSENTSKSATSDDSDYPLVVNRRLTPKGSDRVRVEVSEDCWVGLSTAEGLSLLGILARPGQTLNLIGAGPFRVKLGYTAGVELYFNDARVLLEPYTRNDVASLVIGQ